MNFSVLLLFVFAVVAISFANADRIHVKGKFICTSDPKKAQNIRVRIVDKDIGTYCKLEKLYLKGFVDAISCTFQRLSFQTNQLLKLRFSADILIFYILCTFTVECSFLKSFRSFKIIC